MHFAGRLRMNDIPHVIDERQAAQVLGLKVATLRAWRLKKRGPKFVRFGRAVRYPVRELEDYIAARTVQTTLALSLGFALEEPGGRR